MWSLDRSQVTPRSRSKEPLQRKGLRGRRVAELNAAFLFAHLGIRGELRHAEYIGHWLALLKEDDRAIFTAASKASQAANFLWAFSGEVQESERPSRPLPG